LFDKSAAIYAGLIRINKGLLHKRIAKTNDTFCKKLNAKIVEFID